MHHKVIHDKVMNMNCVTDRCKNKRIYADGKCSPHHFGREPRVRNAGLRCPTDKCGKVVFAKGLCKNCYSKEYLTKVGAGNGVTRGRYSKNKHVTKSGYVYWNDPTSEHANTHGTVYEHRQVMGEYIGRPLIKSENVHHINGDRSDNRLENLELWNTSQPSGQRIEDKVEWAREILALYDGKIIKG